MGKPVYLIGYMGCGKTTTGKKLARAIGYFFFDLDDEIEKLTGKKIVQIFQSEGEDAFRALEHSVVQSLSKRKNIVIATGGGTPCFYDNLQVMNSTGVVVYISMKPESLARRLLNAKVKRPLIEGIPQERLPDFIAGHLEHRESFYNKAPVRIKGENLDMDDLVRLVKDLL